MNLGYLYVATTIAGTVYAQLVAKWRVNLAGTLPNSTGAKISFVVHLFLTPWMITVLVAGGIAAGAWIAALTQFDISRAYPFVALSFIFVLIGSAIFFAEPLTVPKVAGIVLIVVGLAVGSQT
jgi:multidrug transporter EmrE-like cation transporter